MKFVKARKRYLDTQVKIIFKIYSTADTTQAPHTRDIHTTESISTDEQSHMKTQLIAPVSTLNTDRLDTATTDKAALPICNKLLVLGKIQPWKRSANNISKSVNQMNHHL
jgi:hypothetical protein